MTTTTSDPKAAPATPAPAPKPPSDMVTLTIDGQSVTVKKGTLLVEAAKQLQQNIPVFCYHDKLKPVGACRMCLVDIEKMPRLQTACTTPVGEGMIVRTKSEKATDGQNAVVTLLLANHPLDCPICDKGGECPLQDNTFAFGVGTSKFEEEKREKDKAFELSERIILDRERCILCYRCVRFHEEVPGDRALAVLDRGSRGEIGVADGERYDSPLQGNVIDICPVGALTSRQYRFRSRPWDLRRAKGIAKDDPTGANLWIDARDGRVLRLRPRENLEVNDAWLADKTRFETVPAERADRLQTPLIRKDGKLVPATWFEALRKATAAIRHNKTGALVSTTTTNEAMAIMSQGGITQRTAVWPPLAGWAPRGTLKNLSSAKTVVVIGCDPLVDAPIFGLQIRRALVPFTTNGLPGGGGGTLVVVGPENALHRDSAAWLKTSADNTLGVLRDLVAALEGKAGDKGSQEAQTAAALMSARPASIVAGAAIASDTEGQQLLERLRTILGCTDDDSFTGGLDNAANAGGARAIFGDGAIATVDTVLGEKLDTLLVLGDTPHQTGFPVTDVGDARAVWMTALLSASAATSDEVPAFVDVVLPLADTYEQAGSFTSIEGRHQGFDAGGIPPGVGTEKAKADWEALALLSSELGVTLAKDLKGLRKGFAEAFAFGRLPPNKNQLAYALNVM